MVRPCSAAAMACDEAIRRGHQLAAHVLEASADDIQFDQGRYRVVGTDQEVPLMELTARLAAMGAVPQGLPGSLDNVAKFVSSGMTFPNGCHVCEVEIDPDTGSVQVVRYTAVDDVGVMLNPGVIEGQIMGGVAQGLGAALLEEIVYDGTGQLLTGSLMDYAVPRAEDMPDLEIDSRSTASSVNLLGSKGVGEAGCIGVPAALMNAARDALAPLVGEVQLDFPLRPQRLWQLLQTPIDSHP